MARVAKVACLEDSQEVLVASQEVPEVSREVLEPELAQVERPNLMTSINTTNY